MRRWILGEFRSPEELLEAVRHLRGLGYGPLDTYTPFPVEGMEEALHLKPSRVPGIALLGGLSGALLGYTLQWLTNAVDWPLNVGNRPPNSAPVFIPITFESAVLISALFIFGSLIALFGLPRLSHPVFALEAFKSASLDGFWVSITTEGAPEDKPERAFKTLEALGARAVSVLEEGET